LVVPKIKIDEIIQIGIVVRDIQKVADNYRTIFGIGPWQIVRMEPPILTEVTLRGKPVEASMMAAIAQSGNLQLELIQPLEGPSIWKEFLETKGEGLHHVQAHVQDPKTVLTLLKEMGVKALMSGRIGPNIFYYIDTEPFLGIILEFIDTGSRGY
jgi:methylmalonyl-CoA/ethylmalonyl-CoA epimerase